MLTFDEKQKQGWLEEYSIVSALYQVLNEGRAALRTKQAVYRNDEVQALAIDFLLDVELKSSRALPVPLYHMFLRLSETGNMELLPESAKLLLGRAYQAWGLGVEGSYKALYFKTKNEQMRGFMKGKQHDAGIFRATDEPDSCFS